MKAFLTFGLAILCVSSNAAAQDTSDFSLADAIDQRAADVESKVIEWRRDIHQHPELGNRETRTAKKIAQHLRKLGLEVQTGIAHTGVVGVLEGGKPGPVVALRADMDALPVVEQTGLPYASKERAEYNGQEVGVMHACGHDTHVAILMGAAEVLADVREHIPGTVKFIFQPAEEGPPEDEEGGAAMMVREGVLSNDPAPEAIFGLHVTQGWATGQIGVRPAGAMAAADTLRILVKGRQTHAAQPWAGIDPIVAAAQIVVALQTIPSRQIDVTLAPAIVSIGTINGGVRSNIIPDEVEMTGTIRTFDPAMRETILSNIARTAQNVAEASGATAEVEFGDGGLPVTYNDPELTGKMRSTLEDVVGVENVQQSPMVTGAEDFAFYQEQIPGMFFFLGARNPDVPRQEAVPNHSPFFTADEDALLYGVRAMSHLAVDYLRTTD